jgi:hypothetical protein
LACFAGKQSPFCAAGVLNGISSANYHTGVKAEQVFCWLVADSFGEFVTNGYPNGIRAIESRFGLGNLSMHQSVYCENYPRVFYATKVRKKHEKFSKLSHFKKHKANGHTWLRELYPNFIVELNLSSNILPKMSNLEEGFFILVNKYIANAVIDWCSLQIFEKCRN